MSGSHGGVGGADEPLMLPTMVAWRVQWNVAGLALRSTMPREVAPGATAPKSAEPSSNTRWCSVVSPLRNITVSPALAAAGLGENAWLPADATIETVTVAVDGVVVGGGGDGAATAAGVGAVGDDEPPPQLHAANAPAKATAAAGANECRIPVNLRVRRGQLPYRGNSPEFSRCPGLTLTGAVMNYVARMFDKVASL